MKKITIMTMAFFLSVVSAFAQEGVRIKGMVIDSAARTNLTNAAIIVINEKDSILINYTKADYEGKFDFNVDRRGKFILQIIYPGYADFVQQFSIDSSMNVKDFGNLYLTLKSRLLADVVIKGKAAAIKFKGDTTEFNASSYNITPNSKVEDLLRQLPGIQVDKDGKITAQGKAVNKILVDGEEFFGDDPTLVTRNIRGDMVDKVQLYDKKSDQAAFIGSDDGSREKTINVKLKEDKKHGYFGKVEGGIGTDKFYQNQIMFNIFNGKEKFAGYGIFGNTGVTGLAWGDASKYSGNTVNVGGDGLITRN